MSQLAKLLVGLAVAVQTLAVASAQDASVKPGINGSFRDPDPHEFPRKFEVESREAYARRREIVAACEIQPGESAADIGAGTGLFTRVIAVDIAQMFLDQIVATSRAAGQRNVETLLCEADSIELPPSIAASCRDHRLSNNRVQERKGSAMPPPTPMIRELQEAGVEVLFCGQALNDIGFPDGEVAEGMPIAAAALNVVINN